MTMGMGRFPRWPNSLMIIVGAALRGRPACIGAGVATEGHPYNNPAENALLKRHVVNSEYSWQRDVVGAAELNPHGLSGERTEIEWSSENVHSRRAAILITKRRKRC